MDILSQIMVAIKITLQEFKVEMQHIQEECIQESKISRHIMDKYNQERYAWYDFKVDCDDWYMDKLSFLG
jgi:hypothetical protein